MSGGQLNTQVRGQAQPGQDNRFETAAGIPSHREKDDSYRSVIIQFAPRWRVIICKDGAQWIVQHRTADPSHRGVWRGRISTRYDRSPTVFLSAIALVAAVIFWL